MAVLMKEPMLRSLGLHEQKGFARGPFEDLQRPFEVPRVEVAAAALARLWQDLGLGPEAPLIFLGSKYQCKADHHQPRLLDMAVARGQRREHARDAGAFVGRAPSGFVQRDTCR